MNAIPTSSLQCRRVSPSTRRESDRRWADDVALPAGAGPAESAGLGLGEFPSGAVFGPQVMPGTQGPQVQHRGPSTLREGNGVIQMTLDGGTGASGEHASRVASRHMPPLGGDG